MSNETELGADVPSKTTSHVTRDPKPFISEKELSRVIEILAKADKITTEEVVKRLNNMVGKGSLLIVPLIGTKRKEP